MKLLLDTHTLLWSIGKNAELSDRVIHEIRDTGNKVLVSAVSLWEIALKYSIGKLIINSFDIKTIPACCKQMGFEMIPLLPTEALYSLRLSHKSNHKDPFDRMLIYQCIANGYVFVSKDAKMAIYKEDGLQCIW
jgi:PIN domain nuclease of toxin-antitoxin system